VTQNDIVEAAREFSLRPDLGEMPLALAIQLAFTHGVIFGIEKVAAIRKAKGAQP
jgi:hypothetical protein